MKIGYLMNTYPMVSTTFIGREIAGLEKLGVEITRYAIRPWNEDLVDPDDIREREKTLYLLKKPYARLLASALFETLGNPVRVFRAAGYTFRLIRNDRGHILKHIAYLIEAMVLRRAASRDGVTHLHAHFSTNATAVAMLTQILGGATYSFTIHGPDELFAPSENSLGLKVANARFVACISHFARSQAMLFSDPASWSNLRIVHCGVRLDDYGGDTRNRSAKRILFIGRLGVVKGAKLLIDAFANAVLVHPDATLTIIGDGPERSALEAQALELGATVTFRGYQPQEAVAGFLNEADILVLPSFAEGVPVVLMEAMASGIPVIASRVAGIPELVQDGVSGFLVPPGDSETLSARLETLLSDPSLRARMGQAGRAKVEAEFNIDREAAWLAELFSGNGQGLRPASTNQ